MVRDGDAGGGWSTRSRPVRPRERLICRLMHRLPCCPCHPGAWWSEAVCGGSWSCGGSGAAGAPDSDRPRPGSPYPPPLPVQAGVEVGPCVHTAILINKAIIVGNRILPFLQVICTCVSSSYYLILANTSIQTLVWTLACSLCSSSASLVYCPGLDHPGSPRLHHPTSTIPWKSID